MKYTIVYNFLTKQIGPDCSRIIIYHVYNDDLRKWLSRPLFKKASYELTNSWPNHIIRNFNHQYDCFFGENREWQPRLVNELTERIKMHMEPLEKYLWPEAIALNIQKLKTNVDIPEMYKFSNTKSFRG